MKKSFKIITAPILIILLLFLIFELADAKLTWSSTVNYPVTPKVIDGSSPKSFHCLMSGFKSTKLNLEWVAKKECKDNYLFSLPLQQLYEKN